MDQIEIPWLLPVIIAAIAALQTVRLRLSAARPGHRARMRSRHAIAGERSAEKLLERLGYRIEARQPRAEVCVWVDGAPLTLEVRGDLLARRQRRRYLVEVKTGTKAPRITHGPTRRQLLEYRYAFDAEGLLLVDADRGTVQEIAFEAPRTRGLLNRLIGG